MLNSKVFPISKTEWKSQYKVVSRTVIVNFIILDFLAGGLL